MLVFVRGSDNIDGIDQEGLPEMTFALRPQRYKEPGTEDGKQSQQQEQDPVAGRVWFAQGRSVQLKI